MKEGSMSQWSFTSTSGTFSRRSWTEALWEERDERSGIAAEVRARFRPVTHAEFTMAA